MLALGILIIHVALEIRVGSGDVPLSPGTNPNEFESTVTFGTESVALGEVVERGGGVGAAVIGCAYPYPLEARRPSSSAEDGCSNDKVGTKTSIDVATEDRVVEAVTLG
jgi:hypothetical protein